MAKKYTGKLFTGICWKCKRPIAFKGNFFGWGDIIIDCKHCYKENVKTENKLDVSMETNIQILKVLGIILLVAFLGSVIINIKTSLIIEAQRNGGN